MLPTVAPKVQVQVGAVRRPGAGVRLPSACLLVAIAPPGFPTLSSIYPDNILRPMRGNGRGVELMRLTTSSTAGKLPGLRGPYPSRLRDAARLALAGGSPSVDVVLAHIPGLKPWDFDKPEVSEYLDPLLFDMSGAVLIFPDLGGPFPVGPGTGEPIVPRLKRMVVAARRLGQPLGERFQVMCFDLPEGPPNEQRAALTRLIGIDAAVCTWTGAAPRLQAHGWRAASAVVGSVLAARGSQVSSPLIDAEVPLPSGRTVTAAERRSKLVLRPEVVPATGLEEYLVQVAISRGRDSARITSEGSFRRPLGEWPLPCLRTVKALHQRLMRASEDLVFATADPTHAMALMVALRDAMVPFVERGVIEPGPSGGPPPVETEVNSDPTAPGLSAKLSVSLVPWQRDVRVRVSLKPGAQPAVEVANG